MVRKYTVIAYQPTQMKRYDNALSVGDKLHFFNQALDTSDGRCIGIAKTQHRRCQNPVKRFIWDKAMQELIETAEDNTLQSGDGLEDVVVHLAKRMSCWRHDAQESSQTAILKAIIVYRRTFVIVNPVTKVNFQQHCAPPEAYHDEPRHDESTEPNASDTNNIKHEHATDAFEAVLESQFYDMEARIDDKINRLTKVSGKKPRSEPGPDVFGAMLQLLVNKLDAFELRIEDRLNDVQEKHEKDFQTLAAMFDSANGATSKKGKARASK